MKNIRPDRRSRNAAVRETLPDLPLLDLLQQLARGEILEYQSRAFSIRGKRVSARTARNSLKAGFIEPMPNLFNPTGGRITEDGLLKLHSLETKL
jgi:hypothetical protein